MAELKKCPFCGGELIQTYTETVDAETEVYHFRCSNCYSDTYFDYSNEYQSIKDWNNRATEAEIRAKAYDSFMKEIEAEYDNDACPNVTDYLDYKISLRDLFRIVEQLKGGRP